MKTKILKLALAFCAGALSLSGQNIGFWVESDSVFLSGGSVVNRSNAFDGGLNVTVYGGTASSAAAVESTLEQFRLASSPEQKLSDFLAAISSDSFSSFEPIGLSPGTGPFASYDWIGTRNLLDVGELPVLLVLTQPLDELTVNSSVGLVSASITVPAAGTANIGFNTGTGDARWQTAHIGDLGSLTLTAIPEPSTYAAIFGLLTLGLVVLRRRNR